MAAGDSAGPLERLTTLKNTLAFFFYGVSPIVLTSYMLFCISVVLVADPGAGASRPCPPTPTHHNYNLNN